MIVRMRRSERCAASSARCSSETSSATRLAAADCALLVGFRQQLDQQRLQRLIGAQQASSAGAAARRPAQLEPRPQLGGSMAGAEGLGDRPAFDLVARRPASCGQRRADLGAAPLGVDQSRPGLSSALARVGATLRQPASSTLAG